MSPAVLWGLAAAVPAVTAEYLYRTLEGPWSKHLYLWIPLQVLIGYAIYRLVTTPNQTLVDAFITWTLCTTALRVFASVTLLGETVRLGTWVALGLVLLAQLAKGYLGR